MLILLIIVVVSRSIRADNTNKIEKSISLVQLNYQSNQYLNNENLLKKNSEIINIIKRNKSFFDKGIIAHVPMSEPTSKELINCFHFFCIRFHAVQNI